MLRTVKYIYVYMLVHVLRLWGAEVIALGRMFERSRGTEISVLGRVFSGVQRRLY